MNVAPSSDSDAPEPAVIPTGVASLDGLLRGGFSTVFGPAEIIGTDAGVGFLTAKLLAANSTQVCHVGCTEDATGHRPGRPLGPGSYIFKAPTPDLVVSMLLPRVPYCRLMVVWTGMTYPEILEYGLQLELLTELQKRASQHRTALVFCGLGSVYRDCRISVRTFVDPTNPEVTRVRAGWFNGFGLKLGGVFPR